MGQLRKSQAGSAQFNSLMVGGYVRFCFNRLRLIVTVGLPVLEAVRQLVHHCQLLRDQQTQRQQCG